MEQQCSHTQTAKEGTRVSSIPVKVCLRYRSITRKLGTTGM